MLIFFIPFIYSRQHYQLISSFKPIQSQKDLFGRSVAFCSSNQRIVVGASWRKHPNDTNIRSGALYVFDYDFSTNQWSQTQEIYPELHNNYQNSIVSILELGSTVEISSDCNTIIAGAPYSDIVRLDNNSTLNETGCVVIFKKEEGDKYFKQYHIGIPTDPIAGGGFGRSLSISPDGNIFSAANYNKFSESALLFEGQVEVHMSVFNSTNLGWERYILTPPPQIRDGNRYRFGNKLQFLDASTLIVSADDLQDKSISGVYIYKKTFNLTSNRSYWYIANDGINASSYGYNNIGEAFSIPSTQQDFIALLASNSTNYGIIFLSRNDVTDTWVKKYTVDLPPGSTASQLYFCGENQLAVTGRSERRSKSIQNINTLFMLTKSDSNGKFQLYDIIYMPPEDSQNDSLHLNFLSSFAWENEHCFRFAVGAMSKTGGSGQPHVAYEFGKVYVYQSSDFAMRMLSHYEVMPSIGLFFFAGLLIIILSSVIAFYIIKFKRRRQARNISVQV